MVYIHIYRGAPTTTKVEREQIDSLDKYQKRYLKKFGCGACDMSLASVGCGTILDEACPEEIRIERRKKCLEEYKPRLNRREKKVKNESTN